MDGKLTSSQRLLGGGNNKKDAKLHRFHGIVTLPSRMEEILVNKSRHFYTVIVISILSAIICFKVVQVRADQLQFVNPVEKEKIIESVKMYFEARYRSRITLQMPDFGGLIDESSQENTFPQLELEKLEVELYHAKVKQLKYSEAKFILEFTDIQVDEDAQIATILVIEGHDVVFEKYEPTVSNMRNLQHRITLRKDDDTWKITSDDYDDYLWRMIKATKMSKEELLFSIDATINRTSGIGEDQGDETFCSLPDDQSSHPYYRNGAVAYAHQWATVPRPYNPKYYDFTDDGGDCTNFVNQAIHEGSQAEMVFGGTHGYGQLGWYIYSGSDYASAWTGVSNLYDFITQYWVWPRPGIDDPDGPGGPEGCQVYNNYAALEGDLVQFEWDDDHDTSWDHTVIIVRKETPPGAPDNPSFYVAGHSDDIDNYPLSSFIYQGRRFIRVERIDGYAKVYIPLGFKDSSGYPLNTVTNPYPAPMGFDQPTPQPYPVP